MRALTSHLCGSGLIPRLYAICGLSLLLLVVFFASRGIFLWVLWFSPLLKTNISKFQFNPDFSGPIATANSHYYYYYYFYYYYYLLFACLTAWSLNESEAGFDLLLIQPSLLFLCKYLLFSMRTASLT